MLKHKLHAPGAQIAHAVKIIRSGIKAVFLTAQSTASFGQLAFELNVEKQNYSPPTYALTYLF